MPTPSCPAADVPGAACGTACALLVVLALVQAPVLGWASPGTAIPAAVGVVLMSAFLWIEHRSRNPLMPLQLLRRPTLWGGMLVTAAFMASFGLQFFFLTLYLQSLLHETPLIAGMSFLPLAALVVLGNRVGERLATRYGAARETRVYARFPPSLGGLLCHGTKTAPASRAVSSGAPRTLRW